MAKTQARKPFSEMTDDELLAALLKRHEEDPTLSSKSFKKGRMSTADWAEAEFVVNWINNAPNPDEVDVIVQEMRTPPPANRKGIRGTPVPANYQPTLEEIRNRQEIRRLGLYGEVHKRGGRKAVLEMILEIKQRVASQTKA